MRSVDEERKTSMISAIKEDKFWELYGNSFIPLEIFQKEEEPWMLQRLIGELLYVMNGLGDKLQTKL